VNIDQITLEEVQYVTSKKQLDFDGNLDRVMLGLQLPWCMLCCVSASCIFLCVLGLVVSIAK